VLQYRLQSSPATSRAPPTDSFMSTPSPDLEHDAPAWLPWFGHFVTRRGLWAGLTLLCGTVWLMALGLSQLLITLMGRGDRLVATLCASACALLITGVFGYLFLRLVQFQDQTRQRVSHHATLDPLTSAFNRRHFLQLVDREWSRAKRYNMDCAMLLMDVDHFKRVNDTHGHLCGDRLLREIARVSGETLRQADVLARFGGEEFAVFLPHTDPLGALDVAERIRERVEQLDFRWEERDVPVSVSLGVASLQYEHLTLDHLIHDADEALYSAKAAGRNCVRAKLGLQPGHSSYAH